jgi:uncharacterized membrane protein (UPF0127 family)
MTPLLIDRRLLLLAVVVAAAATSCRSSLPPRNQVCARQHCYDVELASSPEETSLGLMHRKHLDADKGMLFIFSQSAFHTFWMKNTLIPLDMIWMDGAHRVVHVQENVPPCQADPCPRYVPSKEALFVLELNAGEAKRLGLQVGDQLEFKLQP